MIGQIFYSEKPCVWQPSPSWILATHRKSEHKNREIEESPQEQVMLYHVKNLRNLLFTHACGPRRAGAGEAVREDGLRRAVLPQHAAAALAQGRPHPAAPHRGRRRRPEGHRPQRFCTVAGPALHQGCYATLPSRNITYYAAKLILLVLLY